MATFDKEYDVPEYDYDIDDNEEGKQNAGANKYDHYYWFNSHMERMDG